jgi:adenine-specific DNA-methyltransferase
MAELIWQGKYDAQGKKQGPVRIALPFQDVETVNESVQERQKSLDMFSRGEHSEWRNRLIWGDKKYVLPSLLPEFAGRVDLIYIDPPFDTGADFSYIATIPGVDDSDFEKRPSMLEQKAYRDTWGRGLDSYLHWFYETVIFSRDLLSEKGAMIVHLDYRVGQYAKVVMDEVFGEQSLINELIWYYTGAGVPNDRPARRHDNLLWYSKGKNWTFHADEVRTEYAEATRERFKHHIGNIRKDGGDYGIQELNPKGKWPDDVLAISIEAPSALERTGYPTQKPLKLLEWIIKACSSENELVLDCFCGSGTTAAVAEKLNRRWITCDLGRFAIHTTRKRLLGIPHVKPFIVQNLGKYERQAWQAAEFPTTEKQELKRRQKQEEDYRSFILGLYKAMPIQGKTWLHGVKAGRLVHVGPVDAPVTQADFKAIAQELWKSAGSGKDAPQAAKLDILYWELAFEMNETARDMAKAAKVDAHFKKIPREVLEGKAVEQGDIQFFELGALAVDMRGKKREVTLRLEDFIIPLDDVPQEVRGAIKHWSQMVDYWAVDWDFKGDTFHNQWQSFRTRKDSKIELSTKHEYHSPKKYTVVVKVIDILGNDTTKSVEVEVK